MADDWRMCKGGTTGAPGLHVGRPTILTIVGGNALWTSDLYVSGFNGAQARLVRADAKHSPGKTFNLLEANDLTGASSFTLEIHVHETGKTITSLSADVMVLGDPLSADYYICFEDEGDTTYDDLILHVQQPDLLDAKKPGRVAGFHFEALVAGDGFEPPTFGL